VQTNTDETTVKQDILEVEQRLKDKAALAKKEREATKLSE